MTDRMCYLIYDLLCLYNHICNPLFEFINLIIMRIDLLIKTTKKKKSAFTLKFIYEF